MPRWALRAFLALAALQCAALLAAPAWDWWHYRQRPGAAPADGVAMNPSFDLPGHDPLPSGSAPFRPADPDPPANVPAASEAPVRPVATAAPAPGHGGTALRFEPGHSEAGRLVPPSPRDRERSIVSSAPSPLVTHLGSDRVAVLPRPEYSGASPGTADARSAGGPQFAVLLAGSSLPSRGGTSQPQAQGGHATGISEPTGGGGTGGGDQRPADSGTGDGATTLSLTPARTTLAQGETVRVSVDLRGAEEIRSVPFHLLFNPDVLEYVGASEGSLFTGTSLAPVLLASVNPNRPGDLVVGLSMVPSSGLLNGSGSVVVLEFLARSAGESLLSFDRAHLMQPLRGDAPLQLTNGSIVVR